MVVIVCGLLLLVAGETQFDLVGFLLVMTAAMLAGLRWTITQVLLHGHKAHGEAGQGRAGGAGAGAEWVGRASALSGAARGGGRAAGAVRVQRWHRGCGRSGALPACCLGCISACSSSKGEPAPLVPTKQAASPHLRHAARALPSW